MENVEALEDSVQEEVEVEDSAARVEVDVEVETEAVEDLADAEDSEGADISQTLEEVSVILEILEEGVQTGPFP